jgi:hypothetical protein
MVREKVIMAFFKPKGMTFHLYSPDLVMIVVFFYVFNYHGYLPHLELKIQINKPSKFS